MNQAFEAKLQKDLDALKQAGTYKRLRHLTTPMAPEVHMEEAGDVIVLSSNNYLGLADQAEVVAAGKEGLDKYGAGTASVRFICGTFDIHRVLEATIAKFLNVEASLSYVSCWNANTGLFPTICDEGSAIVSDELNHASIIDGVRLASKARRERFKHGNMRELEEKLKSVAGCFPIAIVTDGVFSMEGDLAKYGAITVVDDSHGTGVMGETGRGTVEHYGLTGQVDAITGTLGKALGGAAGGFVAGSAALIDTLIQRSRPQLFSNALPATVACSSLAAIEYLDGHPELVRALREKTRYFRDGLKRIGYAPLESESAIVPIIVGETAFAIAISDKLLKAGVFVTGFGFPVVPEGTARIRVQISAALTKDEMDRALAAFEAVGKETGLLKG
jgi:glycine C-acetyltransferase